MYAKVIYVVEKALVVIIIIFVEEQPKLLSHITEAVFKSLKIFYFIILNIIITVCYVLA